MNGIRNKSPADSEIVDVLLTISHISARLARNLAILAAQRQSEEGENSHEQKNRYYSDHRRAPRNCRRY